MKHPENRAALKWFMRELMLHEQGVKSGHAKIMVDIVDGKVHNLEPGERILIRNCKELEEAKESITAGGRLDLRRTHTPA